ncbi:Retrovirus-related Pol polyprotein from transposon RE2 [Vitis vinifera]|uniref:Retrovirus-related Pol polyprotein from transposon RE2 n=1 Tax=Vitis vinifera TaxID=29760 RepID=A0A438HTM5_VITVI|nr:Retrovirus-related Pol polyprotein from transposon RE2 [Vitis vinifera]
MNVKASCGCSAILHVDPTRNCILSQHFHAPTDIYWKSTTRILRYLKGTVNHGIYFSKRTLALTAYYDVDWARDAINRRSTTGYNIFLGPCLVSWCARKQSVVSRSGTSNGGDRIILDTYVVERPPSHFAFTTYGVGGVRLWTIDGTSNSKAKHDVQLDLTVDESQS